jgi:hypothetical protein
MHMTNGDELDEEIERIVERRVEQRLEELGYEETEPGQHQSVRAAAGSEPTSRRRILNTLAGGVAGFGLASILPAGSISGNENPGNVSRYDNKNTTTGFEVGPSGNIDLRGNELVGVDHLDFTDEVVEIGTGALTSRETEADGTLRRGIAIGRNALSTEFNGIAIGSEYEKQTKATGEDAMAIGPDGAQATGGNAYALGEDSLSSASGSIAFGKAAEASDTGAVAVGSNTDEVSNGAFAGSPYTVAIGANATIAPTGNDGSVAIGAETLVETPDIARIGDGSAARGPDQFVFTAQKDTINDGDLNNGEMTVEMDEANDAFRLRGRDSEGKIREARIPW